MPFALAAEARLYLATQPGLRKAYACHFGARLQVADGRNIAFIEVIGRESVMIVRIQVLSAAMRNRRGCRAGGSETNEILVPPPTVRQGVSTKREDLPSRKSSRF